MNCMNKKSMGVCAGRHEIPHVKDGYIFEQIEDVTDVKGLEAIAVSKLEGVTELDLYVTGLTVATLSIVNACLKNNINCQLWHYNNATGEYYCQQLYMA